MKASRIGPSDVIRWLSALASSVSGAARAASRLSCKAGSCAVACARKCLSSAIRPSRVASEENVAPKPRVAASMVQILDLGRANHASQLRGEKNNRIGRRQGAGILDDAARIRLAESKDPVNRKFT